MGTKESPNTPITILLTGAQYRALKKMSQTDERSISWLIRKAINGCYAKAIQAEEDTSTQSESSKDA